MYWNIFTVNFISFNGLIKFFLHLEFAKFSESTVLHSSISFVISIQPIELLVKPKMLHISKQPHLLVYWKTSSLLFVEIQHEIIHSLTQIAK